MKKNDESFNQIYVVSFLKKLQLINDCFTFWHTPNGGNRNIAEASKLKMMGVLAGVPDLTIMAYNNIHFIEFKKGKGKLSKEQNDFISRAGGYGYKVHLVAGDSPSEIVPQVEKIMIDNFGFNQIETSRISSMVLS